MTAWYPSRDAGLAQLQRFLPRAGRDYRKNRNFDNGPGDRSNVSLLSPYIRHRLIHEQEVVNAVLQEHSLVAAEKFIDEIFWRTYWQGWLEHRPNVWQRYLEDVDCLSARLNTQNPMTRRYSAATTGNTGIEPFDAWTDELVNTGYLHNHTRMWFASIWIFTLGLPWQLGADFFIRHLLDGDPASNTLSWRWVAGLHTRGKTYLALPDNIAHYAQRRFADDEALAGLEQLSDQATPCREPAVDNPQTIAWPEENPASGNVGLLVTEEDLSLYTPVEPSAVAVLKPRSHTPMPTADAVLAFKRSACEDTAERARALWPDATVTLLDLPEVGHWASTHALNSIASAYVPRGFVAADIERLHNHLQSVEWLTFAHAYDRLAWPHTQKGFHHLRKHIPAIVEALIQPSLPLSA